jgi:integral membrane sensor domain MASE1
MVVLVGISERDNYTRLRGVALLAIVGLLYFVVAKLGLSLASVHPSATPIWPATGVALGATLLWGYRIAPAIFVSAFVVNQLTAGSLFTSFGIASGNTLEALAASYLVQRWGGGQRIFDDAVGVARFAVIAVVSTAITQPSALAVWLSRVTSKPMPFLRSRSHGGWVIWQARSLLRRSSCFRDTHPVGSLHKSGPTLSRFRTSVL